MDLLKEHRDRPVFRDLGDEWLLVLLQKTVDSWECLDEDLCHLLTL